MSTSLSVLESLFKKRKRLTDLEVQGLTTLNPNSIRPARLKLLRNGAIRKTPFKRSGYSVYEYVRSYAKKPTKQYKKSELIAALRGYKNKLKSVMEDIKKLVTDLT